MTALRQKVFAYITHTNPNTGRTRLLVFTHVLAPEAGIQVPAGTMRPGESVIAAALREAEEETGLAALTPMQILGERTVDMRPWGKDEIHHRHFVHLRTDGTPPETWIHHETDPDGLPDHPPIPFAFRWHTIVPNNDLPNLIGGHDALVPELIGILRAPSR